MQVHFTVVEQFYVRVNVEFFLCSHRCGIIFTRFLTFIQRKKTGMLKFLLIFFTASAAFGVKCLFIHY